jgi:zinc protease
MKARTTALLLSLMLAFVPAGATTIKTLSALKGATVWFVEDHTVPMLAMEVSLPAGSAYDPPGKFGLASFAGSLLDEGAGNLDSKAFHNALANRAINLSVTAERDYLTIALVCQSSDAKEAFRLLGLALRHARFDAEAVSRVRAQMLQNIQEENEDPGNVAEKAFAGAYFAGHPYAHSPDGDPAGLNAINVDDLRNFVHAHWVRGGLKISLSGDTNPQTASALIVSAFTGLPGGMPPAVPSFARSSKAAVSVVNMDVPQPNAVFGLKGVTRSDPDYVPSYVANYILGGADFSSRLTDEVRVRRGLTYDVSTDVYAFRRASVIEGKVATRRDSIRQSVGIIRDVFKKFSVSGATEQELTDAKTYLTGSFPLSFASNASIASQLGSFQQQGLGPDYIARRNDLINAVTLDDIRRVAKRLFDPSNLIVVIAGTPADAHTRDPEKRRR